MEYLIHYSSFFVQQYWKNIWCSSKVVGEEHTTTAAVVGKTNNGTKKFTIDTRLLTKGLYTVKVIVDNKQQITKVLKL